jgi:hypothetical protein
MKAFPGGILEERTGMASVGFAHSTPEELRDTLARDGGRTVMYGGDPYEDDLEPEMLTAYGAGDLGGGVAGPSAAITSKT